MKGKTPHLLSPLLKYSINAAYHTTDVRCVGFSHNKQFRDPSWGGPTRVIPSTWRKHRIKAQPQRHRLTEFRRTVCSLECLFPTNDIKG